jgi:sulfite exporter TauE/SafE
VQQEEQMVSVLPYLIDRMKEPSTYAGIGALAATFGVHVDDAVLQGVVQVATAVFGLAAVLAPEAGAPPQS